MLDRAAAQAVEEFVHAGYDTGAAAILLCESDGTPEEVAEEIERLTTLLETQGATRIEVSTSEAESCSASTRQALFRTLNKGTSFCPSTSLA
ncbi:hypothetical protein R75471_02508 [Paraburkholderia domus]|nr:hypothetical protein R75471_02508 [Paraburkholderia domus]